MQKLFSEFKVPGVAEWKAQLMKDLKGESYESLIWKNENGFDIQPMYSAEDMKHVYTPAFTHANWEICATAKPGPSKTINAFFLKQLNAGASSIALNCTGVDLKTALQEIQLPYIHATFYVNKNTFADVKKYLQENHDLASLHFALLPESFSDAGDLDLMKTGSTELSAYKGIKTLGANVLPFHNQNCDAYYEVALVLSQLTELLEACVSSKENSPQSALVIKTGVSSDYFVQIAKLRAIRRLWKLLQKEYGIQNELYVLAETSLTNKSISDRYNNLLRTTVEAMAAVSGGCNELCVTDFDVLFSENAVLAERMSLNQQLILKEESYFDKMADVACGSYYIETITDAIAGRALETFKYFEQQGGYLACLKKNIFSREIQAQAASKEERLKTGKQLSIGVNKFKNEKEKLTLSAEQIKALQQSGIQNPVLNFELEHFFKPHHA